MPRVVPLQPIASQSFTVTIGGNRWALRIIETQGVMCADVSLNSVPLVSAMRVLAGEPIIPYAYLELGNFVVVTLAEELPAYSGFGVSQFLVYLSAEELRAIPAPKAADFAPSTGVQFLTTDEGFYLTTDAGQLLEAS